MQISQTFKLVAEHEELRSLRRLDPRGHLVDLACDLVNECPEVLVLH